MDIYTGEIVAMNSSPSFNPNDFLYGIGKKKWKDLNSNPSKPLINKTISGLYSPGSTIKPIVALSALENNIISPDLKVNCKGHKNPLELYGSKYHCWQNKEGKMAFWHSSAHVLAQSGICEMSRVECQMLSV